MEAKVIAGFTVNAGLFRSLVSAYLAIQDEFYWVFTRTAMEGTALDATRVSMIDFSLFPVDYRSEVVVDERVWVFGRMEELMKVARRFKKREEIRVEVRDDNKFYVGPFKVGDVIPEEDVPEDWFKPAKPKVRFDAKLTVVTADFRRIVKRAEDERVYDNIGINIKGREATIIFFNEKHSRMDLKGYEPWLVDIEGEAISVYTLERFEPLFILGLTDIVNLQFENKGVVQLSYSGSDFWVKFYLAPRTVFDDFIELLEKPVAVRKALWVLRGEEVKTLMKTVRAINSVTRQETFNIGMTGEDLWLYWKQYDKGYFRVSKGRFEEWYPPTERMSGVFDISSFATWLKDVEDLTCFLEGEPPEAMLLLGKGEKIAPKEIRSLELVKEIEVPEVRGIEVFSGSTSILSEVISEAETAGEAFLVFISTPFDIEALGRDIVYYRATLPLDAFKTIEENFIPVDESYFKGLRSFFTSFPGVYVTLGKEDNNIFVKAENKLGELRALIIQSAAEVEDAIKAYKKEIEKPPPPPPEVKPLPEVVKPPPPIEYVEVRFLKEVPKIVGADMKVYGPFKEREIGKLPKINADIFVKQGIATYELVPPPIEVEVPVVPPKPPIKLTAEESGRLADFFIEKLREGRVPYPTAYKADFEAALDINKTYDENLKIIERIADGIIKKVVPPPIVKPPPPPPPVITPQLEEEIKKWNMIGLSAEYISREMHLPLEAVKKVLG